MHFIDCITPAPFIQYLFKQTSPFVNDDKHNGRNRKTMTILPSACQCVDMTTKKQRDLTSQ